MVTNAGNAGETGNLEPGTAAPRSGTYVCCWCGPGGLAQSMARSTDFLLPDRGTSATSELTALMSKRLTVYTIAAGERLPQCPTCGSATGWDLLTGTLEDLLQRRVEQRDSILDTLGIPRPEPADPQEAALDRLTIHTDETRGGAPCDGCGRPLAPAAGYLLSTPQVLTAEAYWRHVIRLSAPELDGLPDRSAQEAFYGHRLRARERDRTPWLICDGCTEMFLVDWSSAREHVLRGTRPRRPGLLRNRFALADYVLPAARAWTSERGWWPATLVPPVTAADDECDLCEKPVWPKETVAFMKPDVVEEWTRAGALTVDSATPPRSSHGEPGWLACGPCLAGVRARLYRLQSV